MQRIDFQGARTTGSIVNDTFSFVRENIVNLGNALGLIALPVLLLGTVMATGIAGNLLTSIFDPTALKNSAQVWERYNALVSSPFFWVSIFSNLIGSFLLWATIYTFIIRYKAGLSLAVADVWEDIRRKLSFLLTTLLGGGLLMFLGIMLPYLLLTALVFGAISTVPLLGGLLTCFGLIGLIIWMFYLIAIWYLIYPIREEEKLGIWQSFMRARELMKGKVRASVSLMLVMSLIVFVLAMIFSLPSQLVLAAAGVSVSQMDLGFKILFYGATIVNVIANLFTTMVHIAFYFQYFSLVEQKEGTSLDERINAI